MTALIWLKENTDTSDIVFANPKLSNYVPRISGNKVYVGHWAQTIDFEKKNALAEQSYANGLFPEFFGVDYVLWYQNITIKTPSYYNSNIVIYKVDDYE